MDKNIPKKQDPQLISYITLRKAVGILAILFPVIIVVGSLIFGGCDDIQSNLSMYYHTRMRNVFVGILCAIALFLFAYNGYDRIDAIAGNVACVFALLIAFFPTSVTEPLTPCILAPYINDISSSIHFFSAGGFFIVLAYFSIFLFTKKEPKPTKMKLKRNKLYRICGYIILGCIFLMAGYYALLKHNYGQGLQKYDPILWLETLALWAFGVSWLTKGNTILTDKKVKTNQT
jgi:hypothetical protein